MPCSSCGQSKVRKVSPQRVQEVKNTNARSSTSQPLIAPASTNKKMVKLRYYGGGMTYQTSGCHSCGSSGKYALTTSETIQFASDDSPMGWFSKRFDVGRDYYVTEKQAEYLLKETFTNQAGQVINKFKVVE